LKVPAAVLGKKIKCKHCGHAFVAEDPNEKAKPSKPGKPAKPAVKAAAPKAAPAKPAAPKPSPASPPPPPAVAPKNDEWEDENVKVELIKEDDDPRCPHCAQLLDPPDARVCLSCGFNSLTRTKAVTKKVWAPDASDWILHLLPGIITLLIAIALITFDIISIFNMRGWLTGSLLESDEADASGKKKMYVSPGFFIFVIIFFCLPVIIPCATFAYKRLCVNYRPVDKVKG
jgi:DNA-directed RNA polymerase subunit RPC12/RpoP